MRKTSAVSVLLGLALLAGMGYGLFVVARLGAGAFDALDPHLRGIGAAAAGVLLLCACVVANAVRGHGRRADLRQARTLRAPVYEQALWLAGGTELDAVDARMALHASPAVLAAWLRVRRGECTAAELAMAMRRDLGQRAPDVPLADLAELAAAPVPARFG